MQADWEVEIGGEAPVIDACWPGLVDLRCGPHRVAEIEETQALPALADALVLLNAKHSPVGTAKCDVWTVDEVDAFELDAEADEAACGLACYIDLLPAGDRQWASVESAVEFCKGLCAHLEKVPLRCCRADLIVRRAIITPEAGGLGITAYLTACGPREPRARGQLESALAAFADAVAAQAPPVRPHSSVK
ncbi:MAG: hypothetical protein WBF42_17595 [Terracidiphilus sp.]